MRGKVTPGACPRGNEGSKVIKVYDVSLDICNENYCKYSIIVCNIQVSV